MRRASGFALLLALAIACGGGVEPSSGGASSGGPSADDAGPGGPVTLTGTSATTIYETEQASITIAASDPTTRLSAGTLPFGATFTPSGASGVLAWTPTYEQAGTYRIDFTASSDDPTRTVKETLVLTVGQYADPVLDPLAPEKFLVGAQPIGDFDGDGFGDLVVCSAVEGTYHARILFGSAGGLPLAAPYPAERTKVFGFPPGSTNPYVYCYGGDYDGDGHADVVFHDGAAVGGRVWVLFGGDRAIATPTVIELVKPSPVAGTQGGELFIGDWNGDHKADVAGHVSSYLNTSDDRLFIWLGGERTDNTTPIVHAAPAGFVCAAGSVLGFADVDGDGKDDILEDDQNVTPALKDSCGASDPNGGARVLHGANGVPTTIEEYAYPSCGYCNKGNNASGAITLCDVDHDGAADLIARDVYGHTTWFFYSDGTKIAAPSPLDPGAGATVALFDDPRCVKGFYSKSTLLLPRQSNRAIEVVLGGNRTPKIDRTLRSPDPDDGSFGRLIESGSADVNGDGKADIVVRSDTKLWLLYGR